ncbi:MAG TPA: peroxidase family protein, partial [Polyangiales bacterium]
MANVSSLAAKQSDPSSGLEHAKELLQSDQLKEAVSTLEGLNDPTGAAAELLGVAYFRLEDYARAANQLRVALVNRPMDRALQRLFERAVANDVADVQRAVPEPSQFDLDALSAGPRPGDHENIQTPPPSAASLIERVRNAIGIVSGVKLGNALGVLTKLLGREPRSSSLWTSWYNHELVHATIMLAHRRDRLNKKQLFAAYPKEQGTGHFRGRGAPPKWVRSVRTADGSYNDLDEPMAGAAGTRFGFNTDPTKAMPESGARLLTPNPRTVSRVLMTRKDGFKPVPFLNLTAAPWIQFMVHDWVSYGDVAHDAEPYRLPLSEDDPARKSLLQTHMLVKPTQQDPTRKSGENVASHINEVTSWWDGSQIYGSSAQTIDSLRSHEGGKLRLDPRTGNLPVSADGVEQTGFRRNWWLGMSMLHTLFAKEHNAICEMLAARYPKWNDQRLFDVARLINAAVMAKIHTVEWTPAILPNEALNAAMNANWYGMLTNALRSKKARKTLADINVADPIAGGIVGNAVDNHGVPYSLTREFLSVYRLHSLLPDQIAIYKIGGGDEPEKTLALAQLRQAGSHKVTNEVSMGDLFYSFGRQHPGMLVLNNFPDTLQNLSIPGSGFYDLGAVDVLRDRERGVPRYNQFRRLMGMKPIHRFEDLSEDVEAVKALKQV